MDYITVQDKMTIVAGFPEFPSGMPQRVESFVAVAISNSMKFDYFIKFR